MKKKYMLDNFEQNLEDHIDSFAQVKNYAQEESDLLAAAKHHVKKKKSITIRLNEDDLHVMQLKAKKLGIGYQTYINMLIHHDAMKRSKQA